VIEGEEKEREGPFLTSRLKSEGENRHLLSTKKEDSRVLYIQKGEGGGSELGHVNYPRPSIDRGKGKSPRSSLGKKANIELSQGKERD